MKILRKHLVLVLFVTTLCAAEANWPRWRGPDSNGTMTSGHYPVTWDPDRVLWKVEVSGKGTSTPIVWQNKIYLTTGTDGSDTLLALDWSGHELWQRKLGFEAKGKHQNASGSNPSPVTDGSAVFVFFKSGNFAAIELDGSVRWQTNLFERYGKDIRFWDFGTSPALTKKDVVMAHMHDGESWLAAFDKVTGDVRWKVPRNYETPVEGRQGYTTPIVFSHKGTEALLVWGGHHLTAHDAANGRILWSCGDFNPDETRLWGSVATPVIAGDVAVVPCGRDDKRQPRLHGIKMGGSGDVTATHRLWKRTDTGPFIPCPTYYKGRVYITCDRGRMDCIDPLTGESLWIGQFPKSSRKFYGSPLIAGGHLYAVREDGVVFVLSLEDKFEIISEIDMKEGIIASPIAISDRLLIRTKKHLFCIGTPAKDLSEARHNSHGSEAAIAPRDRPNVLFILADDVTYNDLGCFGGQNVKTPNIDRLAREGMRFTRAYCAMAMCAPFRAELYTGLYPVRNGVAWNHSKARPGTKSICHHLKDLGYRVGLTGKKHASPAGVFPFDTVKGFPAGEGVRRYITEDADTPFCLFVCSNHAHPPWRSGDASKIDLDSMTLPPVIHDNPVTRTTFAAYLAEIAALDQEVGDVLQLLDETGRADNTLVMFSSEQGWDFAFGKWTNWDIGVHSGLVARWPGHVEPNTQTDALVQMADMVPTLMAAAGADPSVCNLDGASFLPVLQGTSNTHRQYVYGLHNNVPEGNPYPIRSIRDDEFHYLVNLRPDQPYHEKHLMTEGAARRYDLQWWRALSDAAEQGDALARALFNRYHIRPREELYRVDADPWEMNNLADKPQYTQVKTRLRTALERWMTEQKDPGAAMDNEEALAANRQAGRPMQKQSQER